ncbi:MAG: hypothetical protein RIR11_536 [Bacteroidota bacterium]|jgi:hypothetical protein
MKNTFKLFTLLVAFLLIPNLFYAQKNLVAKYWNLINKAELSIIQGNYSVALLHYDSAFALNIVKSSHDLYNASLSANYCEQFPKTRKYCEELIKMGTNFDFFNKKQVYDPFRKSEYWAGFELDYQQGKIIPVNIDKALKERIEPLFFLDQEIRMKRKDKSINQEDLKITIRSRDDSIFNIFSEIVKRYGYPSESKIGVFQEDTTFFSVSQDIIIRHAYQNNNFSLTDRLKESVFEGTLSPEQFMAWYMFEIERKEKKFWGPIEPYIAINKNIYFESPKPEWMASINKNRESLMLCSFDDMCQKIIYHNFGGGQQKGFRFRGGGLAVFGVFPIEEEAEIAKILTKTIYSYGANSK